MILGGAVVTNGHSRCDLIIENSVPVLRDKDILGAEDANTPCRRIYLVIQLMYVDEKNLAEYHNTYWKLVHDVVNAAPSMHALVGQASEEILTKNYYQALKTAKELIDYEQEVLSHAC